MPVTSSLTLTPEAVAPLWRRSSLAGTALPLRLMKDTLGRHGTGSSRLVFSPDWVFYRDTSPMEGDGQAIVDMVTEAIRHADAKTIKRFLRMSEDAGLHPPIYNNKKKPSVLASAILP